MCEEDRESEIQSDPLTIIEENGCFMYRDLCE